MRDYVCYYRVSTKTQNLGLEAQQTTCHQYVKSNNGNIIAEFSEKESGKNDNRPEMLKAIEYANSHGAVFLVAKLDRLTRSFAGGAAILEKINDIAVVDLPELNTLTKGIFLAVGAYERELISKRTKAALAAKKAQGFPLGSPRGGWTDEQREQAKEKKRANADIRSKQYIDLIKFYREKDMTQQEIADKLNSQGFKTPRGKAFKPGTIAMYLKRVEN